MITWKEMYEVLSAMVPLYAAMLVAYFSVRRWRVFTPEQCSGINRFVAVFAVPLLSFHFISTNNPYAMNYRFLAADSLQKLAVLAALYLRHRLRRGVALDWSITIFSLSTLPNTLVMGIPLLRAMYGDSSAALMVQIVVLQSVLWYTLMLFLFEYRAARALIAEQFPPGIAASIASFRVDSDVISLAAAPLQAESDIAADGRVRVFLRRSTAPSITNSSKSGTTPRPSNLTGVEIYSLQSSRESTPRGPSFNQTDFYSMLGSAAAAGTDNKISRNHNHHNVGVTAGFGSGSGLGSGGSGNVIGNSGSGKELHMYVWSASSASPVSEANLKNAVNRAVIEPSKAMPMPDFNSFTGFPGNGSPMRRGEQTEMENGVSFKSPAIKPPTNGSPYATIKKIEKDQGGMHAEENQSMPAASVMSRLILIMVWRKLIRNPNTYSSLIGLVWSFVSYRWNIEMPEIIKVSIAILSDAGLGMAMFSLGLFMALQPKIISCGKSVAAFSMFVRFLSGPAVMAAASIAVGIRGVLLHIAIVQAALPQGIVPFVLAKEYNCHPDILSTAVIFGMLIALPITILYYILLGV